VEEGRTPDKLDQAWVRRIKERVASQTNAQLNDVLPIVNAVDGQQLPVWEQRLLLFRFLKRAAVRARKFV